MVTQHDLGNVRFFFAGTKKSEEIIYDSICLFKSWIIKQMDRLPLPVSARQCFFFLVRRAAGKKLVFSNLQMDQQCILEHRIGWFDAIRRKIIRYHSVSTRVQMEGTKIHRTEDKPNNKNT